MSLTRLNNLISDRTGRLIYVNPDDFNATDLISNNGNSPTKPFKTLQRAIIEVARFSYVSGQNNDRYDQFTIVLSPGDYIVDNRPGLATVSGITALSDQSNFDITDPSNDLVKYNSTDGGMIIPRGTSIVGMDLRKTRIRPRYVPDPQNALIAPTSIFKITGACYFWQFSLFDGLPLSDSSGQGGVYKNTTTNLFNPLFSHHKLTCFEYADKTNLDLFYQKIALGLADIPDNAGEIAARTQENRIVGPLSDIKNIANVLVQNTTATITLTSNHDYFVGQQVSILGIPTAPYSALQNTYYVINIPDSTSFVVSDPVISTIPAGLVPSQYITQNSIVKAEIDTVDSSSPYIFNISLRSTWGLCGVLADGSKVTGFKSMVIAQFTGVSLQKDDNAFIKFTESTSPNPSFVLNGQADAIALHQDSSGYTYYRQDWRHYHIKMTNSSFIQSVSVFAVGFGEQHVCETGGDYSLTNSNSNFGALSLIADGYRSEAYNLDKYGYLSHIVTPQTVSTTVNQVPYYAIDIQKSKASIDNTRLYIYGQKDPTISPAFQIQLYKLGGKVNDQIFVNLVNPTSGALNETSATISPNGVETQTISTITKNTDTGSADGPNTFTTLGNHGYQTGTPLRFTSSTGYFPLGIQPSALYYCIRISNTKFRIAPTEEDARAGAGGITSSITKIRSTIPTITGTQTTLKAQAFVRDTNPDLTNFVITSVDTTLETFSTGSYTHGFTTGDPIFFKTVTASGVALPQTSTGTLSTTTEYYVYIDPTDASNATRFKIATSQANALNGVTVNMTTTGTANGIKVFKTNIKSPLRFDPAQGNWYVSVFSDSNNSIHATLKNPSSVYSNPLITTTENAYLKRVDDNRANSDRIYRLRYVISKNVSVARPPQIGYVIKRKTDSNGAILAHESVNGNTTSEFNRVYYIYKIDTINEQISNEQDGIYYLTVLLADISPKGLQFSSTDNPFSYLRYSQDTASLYPAIDKDNPVANAPAAVSVADNLIQGYVYTGDDSTSITRESINAFLSETGYTASLTALDGKATSGREDRLIPFNSSSAQINIELRRPSQIRAGNQTFEYTGFSSGNYSAAFPSSQNRTLSDKEILFSQSQKRAAGIVFYSGLNSYGDLYVGNQKINAITGEVTLVDKPILKVSGSSTVGSNVEYVPYVSGSDPKSVNIDGAIATGSSADSVPNVFNNKSKFNQGIQVARQLVDSPTDTIQKALISHDLVLRPKQLALESSYNNYTFKEIILNSDNEVPNPLTISAFYPGDMYYKPVISGDTRSQAWLYTGTSNSIPVVGGSLPGWVQAGLIGTGHLTSIEDSYTGTSSSNYVVTGRFGINKTTPSGALHVGSGDVWIDNNLIIGTDLRTRNLVVASGVITTESKTTEIFKTATTLNLVASGTTINIGSAGSGSTTTLKNENLVLPNIQNINTTNSGTVNLLNTSLTNLNFANSAKVVNSFTTASSIGIGSGIGTLTINNPTLNLPNLSAITSTQSSVTVLTGVTNINIGSFSGTVLFNNSVAISGSTTIQGSTTVKGSFNANGAFILGGDFTVKGTNTTIGSTNVNIAANAITLNTASGVTPTDTTANSGGIILKGTTDKSILWNSTGAQWSSSENFNIASGKEYRINSTSVLTSTTLGASVVNSSLKTLGTITTGVWNGTTIAIANGGTGATTANTALNNLLPSQSGFNGTGTGQYFLRTDGTNTSWTQIGIATLDQVLAAGSSSSRAISVGGITCTSLAAGSGAITGGSLSVTGDVTAFASDERLKTDIEKIDTPLAKLLRLNGFTYSFNSTAARLGLNVPGRHVGVSAQEVQKVLPEAVAAAPISENYLTVKYDKLVPLLIEAIKELKAEVDDLKAKLEK
jgi:hypothetical protein